MDLETKKLTNNYITVIGTFLSAIGILISWASLDWAIFNWIMLVLCYVVILLDVFMPIFDNKRNAFLILQLFCCLQLIAIFVSKKLYYLPDYMWRRPIYLCSIILAIIGMVIMLLGIVRDMINKINKL